LIFTTVSPSSEPSVGVNEVIVGGATYVNSMELVEGTASVVTTTLALPAAPLGVVALSSVDDSSFTAVAAVPPTVTVECVSKPVPSISTTSPPAVSPSAGVTFVIVGGVTYVNPSPAVEPDLPLPPMSVTSTGTSPAL